jgi:hypothetical protein
MPLLLISPAAAFAYAVAGLSRLLGCKQHAIARAGIEAGLVEDVFVGCGIPEGAAGAPLSRREAKNEAGVRTDFWNPLEEFSICKRNFLFVACWCVHLVGV